MFPNLGLFSLILLILLLPQAQSGRVRFSAPHHSHRHAHATSSQSNPIKASQYETPKPHIEMVTGSSAGHPQYADFNIAMVSVPHHQHHDVQDLGNMLATPVSGPNPGGNSEILAMSGKNPQGNMLDTSMPSLNPGGNPQSLLVAGGLKPAGGNSNTLGSILDTPVSGPNPGGNSNTLGSMLNTPVSGPNPGGNSQSLAVSGPNPGGNAETLSTRLHTVPYSESLVVLGPIQGGNTESLVSILDTPVSGPNPGGKGVTSLGSMLDTPVSSPNPGGNAQNLVVSGPNPGGNSATLANELFSTPVSGRNPGDNLQILSAGSGPNPGGNSQILAASSGPNPGGNKIVLGAVNTASLTSSSVVGASKASSLLEPKSSRSSAQSDKFPAAASGSNVSQKAELLHEGGIIFSELPRAPVPPSGPSPSHNSMATQQGLFAERKLRGDIIGCEQEASASELPSRRLQHFEAFHQKHQSS